MILVVDSGSTKTDWIALDNEGEEIFSTQTLGLNPQMLSNEILNERIKNNFHSGTPNCKNSIKECA